MRFSGKSCRVPAGRSRPLALTVPGPEGARIQGRFGEGAREGGSPYLRLNSFSLMGRKGQSFPLAENFSRTPSCTPVTG